MKFSFFSPTSITTIFAVLLSVFLASAFIFDEKTYVFYNAANSTTTESLIQQSTQKPLLFKPLEKTDFAFLLLGKTGKGEGGKWHFAPDLADTIMVIYYRPKEKTADVISLPRDLYGDFGGETFKINEIIQRNKINQLLEKLPEITGISTNKFLIIDLSLVKNFIEEIGGIDVKLDSAITDPITGYTLKAGSHHLNGDDTVWLIRNRNASGGDFFREKNQQIIIETAYKRYKSLNPIEKMKLFVNLGPQIKNVKTNIGFSELLSIIRDIDEIKFKKIILDFSTGLLKSTTAIIGNSTAYILIPETGMNNYEAIKRFIVSQF